MNTQKTMSPFSILRTALTVPMVHLCKQCRRRNRAEEQPNSLQEAGMNLLLEEARRSIFGCLDRLSQKEVGPEETVKTKSRHPYPAPEVDSITLILMLAELGLLEGPGELKHLREKIKGREWRWAARDIRNVVKEFEKKLSALLKPTTSCAPSLQETAIRDFNILLAKLAQLCEDLSVAHRRIQAAKAMQRHRSRAKNAAV